MSFIASVLQDVKTRTGAGERADNFDRVKRAAGGL